MGWRLAITLGEPRAGLLVRPEVNLLRVTTERVTAGAQKMNRAVAEYAAPGFLTTFREAHDGSWSTGDVEFLHPAAKSVWMKAQDFGGSPLAINHARSLLEHSGDVFALDLLQSRGLVGSSHVV
jgi:hypothetical protein